MPVSSKLRSRGKLKGKVAKRDLSIRKLSERIEGYRKILNLVNRATQGRIDVSDDRINVDAIRLGL